MLLPTSQVKNPPSLTLAGTRKLALLKPKVLKDAIPETWAEIKIPGKMGVRRWE
jgi:hypothetical protein